jgi:hypothetical protein
MAIALFGECEKLIFEHWHRVERLAQALLVRSEIVGTEAKLIILA